MRAKFLAGGLAVAAAVGILAVLWAQFGRSDDKAVRDELISATPVVATGASPMKVEVSSVAKGVPAPVQGDVRPSLFARARTAADLRVFVFEAKKEVDRGGALYANDALQECRLFRSDFLKPDRISMLRKKLEIDSSAIARDRLVALDWLERRCAGFTDEELGLGEQRFLAGWAVDKDPLWRMRRRSSQLDRSDVAAQWELVGSMLATGDPLLLDAVRGAAMVQDPEGSGELVSYLNGVKFAGLDQESYIYSWKIAVCTLTQSCSMQNASLRAECALEGKCFDSLQSQVLDAVGDQSKADRINETAKQIEQVLRRGEVRALLPEKSR